MTAHMRFVNSSDSNLCVGLSPGQPEKYCTEIKAHTTARWNPQCSRTQPISVVLTVGPGDVGRLIYNKTLPCIEWEDADATFIIKQVGVEFMVTDSLPSEADATPDRTQSN